MRRGQFPPRQNPMKSPAESTMPVLKALCALSAILFALCALPLISHATGVNSVALRLLSNVYEKVRASGAPNATGVVEHDRYLLSAGTLSGRVLDGNGNPITTGRTIRLIHNGVVAGKTATSDGAGVYTFNGLNLSSGDQIAAYLSGATEQGITATVWGASDLSDFDIKAGQLTVRSDGRPISNSDLANDDSTRAAEIPFTVTGGALATTDGTALQINSSSTFAPGGAVTVGGNWINNGTFIQESNLVSFNGSGTQTLSNASGAESFIDATIAEGAGAKVQLLSNLTINGILNLSTAGSVLELNGKALTLNGNVTGPGNFKGDTSATLNVGGTNSGVLGMLNFLSGARTLSVLTMFRTPVGVAIFENDMQVNTLNLNNGVVAMDGTFTLTVTGPVNHISGWIFGNLNRTFPCTTTCSITFDVGTLGYSPVTEVLHVSNTPATYSQTVRAVEGQHPSIDGINALRRYWTVSPPSPAVNSADLVFKYRGGAPPNGDVSGTEANYQVFKIRSGVVTVPPNQSIDTSAHTATITGVTSFSDWTLAEPPAACAAPPSGMVSWIPAENNATDIVGANNGTLKGGVTFMPGKVGQALSFDGKSGSVSFGSAVIQIGQSDFTLQFWIRTTATEDENILDNRQNCGNGSFLSIGLKSSGAIHAEVDGSKTGLGNNSVNTGPINDGAFHHIMVVRQGTNLMAYVDGALAASSTAPDGQIASVTGGLFQAAAAGCGNSRFTGQLDEIQAFNRALSPSELQSIFNAPGGVCTTAASTLVNSITRSDASPTTASSVNFIVTFTKQVTGVDASDFVPVTEGSLYGAQVTSVTGTLGTYLVTVGNYTGTGKLRLDLVDDDSITDGTQVLGGPGPNNGTFQAGQIYDISGADLTSFVVTKTADTDDGVCSPADCSLREAIQASNADPGAETILFNIPSTDPGCNATTHVCTIFVGGTSHDVLPAITDSVFINGYSQPGASSNTQLTTDNAALLIELDGSNAIDGPGLQLKVGGSTIKGLVVNRFSGPGIDIAPGASANVIAGNFIGTNSNGTGAIGVTGNAGQGIHCDTAAGGNTIGGAAAADRNVIAANSTYGIELFGSGNNTLQGNFIGLAADGSTAIGNGNTGIALTSGSSSNIIGGVNPGEANIIAFKSNDGISIDTGTRNLLRGNSISAGGITASDLGIDLGNDGITPNDSGDGDAGANNLQNFPVLISAIATASSRQITGTLNSNANRTFTIDFYVNDTCGVSGHGEGKTYLGSLTNVTTDVAGNASFTFAPATLNVGDVITATATDLTLFDDDNNPGTPAIPHNDTSEFSACLTATGGTPGTLQFSAANYDTVEGNVGTHTVTVTVTRTGGSDGAASVNFATSDGTATIADNDYVAISGSLNWGAGDATSRTFDVTIVGDQKREPDETINLTLSASTGALISGLDKATITILAGGQPPVASDVNAVGVVNQTKTITLTATDADGDAQTFKIVSNPQHGTLANFGTPSCSAGVCTETVDYTPANGYTGTDSFTYNANDGTGDGNTATVTITIYPCQAAFTVNSLGDTSEANPGDGICADANGQCTLRAAIQEANADQACGTITIDLSQVSGQINLTSVLPPMSANLIINGPGPNSLTVLRSGVVPFGIFEINNNTTVDISGVTISNGNRGDVGTNTGGGILNAGILTLTNVVVSGNSATGGTSNQGGGIFNTGTLTISDSTIGGNNAGGSGNNDGSGIYNAGTFTLINSTVSTNTTNGTGNGQGGGIFNSGTMTGINSTLSGNSAAGGLSDLGGGIFNSTAGSLMLTNCTIANNSASGGSTIQGGGIYNLNTASARNTIVSGNTAATGPDINGTLTSLGHNLIGNTGGTIVTAQPGDKFDGAASPLNLGTLQNNGGRTQTMALGSGSVAIDAGDDCVTGAAHCGDANIPQLTSDQRDLPFLRKNGPATDIGAYESDSVSVPIDSDITINRVDEGAAAGTAVGITASSGDAQGGLVSYLLTGDTSLGGFTVDSSTGVVTVADPVKIDYEGPPGHAYTITVQASSDGVSSSQSFSIAVNDVAPSTPIDTDVAPNSVAECAASGTSVGLTASATDVNGPAVTYSLTGDTSGGGFTINSSTGVVTVADATKINYESASGHAYSITVLASDGTLTSSQIFSIAVSDVAPVGSDNSYSVNEGATLAVSPRGVLVNDSDCNGGTVTAALQTGPAHASSFVLNADGSFTYTPSSGFFGTDSFTYLPNDGGLNGNPTTVTITIKPVAGTPSVTNASTLEDTQTAPGNTGELVISRNVNDGVEVTYFQITNIRKGRLFRNNGFTRISDGDFIDFATAHAGLKFKPLRDVNDNNGTCSFDVRASLNNSTSGLGGGIVTAFISVTPVNDVPSFVPGQNRVVTIDAGPQTVIGWATKIAPGPVTAFDEVGQTLNFIVTNDNNALFSVQPAVDAFGTLTYTPATGVSGTANVILKLHDDGGGTPPNIDTSPNRTFTITVNCTNNVVTNTIDSGLGSLRNAIANACPGDTITFSNTTAGGATNFFDGNSHIITLTSELPIDKDLDIEGPGATALTVNANGTGRAFNITTGAVTLNALTVTGGAISGAGNIGAGILNAGTLTLINLVVSGNNYSTADGGGGIGNNGGTLRIGYSTISGNSGNAGAGSGGGVYSIGGTLRILGSTITGNSAGTGGGIASTGSTALLNSTISGNSAAGQGGGVSNVSGTLAVYDSTITGNTADNNNATSSSQGGGIATDTAALLRNTIVAGNLNFNNPGPNTPDDINGGLDTANSLNNLIGDAATAGGLTNTTNGNIVGNGGSGTVDTNTVLNPSLADNGGPTQTHLLRSGSPAIDAGTNLTSLNGAIDDVTTTVTVADATGIPFCSFCLIQVETEQILVLSKSANTLTVFRGANNTFTAAHADGTAVNPALDQRLLFSRNVGAGIDIGAVEVNYTITATAGTPQSAAINTAFATQLQATVSESGTAQSGVPVTFTAPGSGASGTFSGGTTVNTDASGIATAPPFTANGIANGPYDVIASIAGNTATDTFALTNVQTDQTITFNPLPDRTFGEADFTVNASASSGLTVSLTATGNCTVTTPAPGTIHLTGAGSCTITASQPGDSNFTQAADVAQSFNIAKADQTITFAALANQTFGNSDFTISATATSGLPVAFAASGNCTVAGNTVHLTAAGLCTITASQAGDSNYNAAADVPQVLTIDTGPQVVAFGALSGHTFGDGDFTVGSSVSSGLPVTLTATGSCTVTSPAPGTVHITGAGSCTITASRAADSNYSAAVSISRTFIINKANQGIAFGSLAGRTFGDADFGVSATASSGLPVSLAASGNCTVSTPSPASVHITGAGSCLITASQPGNANFNAAANLTQNFTINKANQTIAFAALANKTFGDPDFTVVATATSGLPISFNAGGICTIAGSTVHLTGSGACTITAAQVGNPNYNPASNVPQSFTINKGNQTITFGALAAKAFGDPDFTVSATVTSGLPLSFSASGNCTITGNLVHITAAGSCTITASQASDANYNAAANVSQILTVNKAGQTISFDSLPNKTFGNPDFPVSATTSSGLPVSLGAAGTCTIAGNQVHITAAGSCTITASQAGDSNYSPAANVPQSFTIGRAPTTTSITSPRNPSDLNQAITLTATVISAAGIPSGTVQFKDSGSNLGSPLTMNANGMAQFATSSLTSGTHTITAEYSGATNFQTSTGTLALGQIVKSQPTISIDDVSSAEGDTGTTTMNFTVKLSNPSSLSIKVDFASADGTATSPSDYLATNGTLTFNPGDSSQTIAVTIKSDVLFEPDETFTVNLANAVNATIAKAAGTGTILNDDPMGGLFNLSQSNYGVNESTGFVTVTINRNKDVSRAASVDYTTDDTGASIDCATLNSGLASSRCDYTTMIGTIAFAANETQKTINIPINRDGYTEGSEVFHFNLANPTGGAALGPQSSSTVTIADSLIPTANALDNTDLFVRQQYHDFLNREPEPSGVAFWTDNIELCRDPLRIPPGETIDQCLEQQRIMTSAAFFLSIEFRQTGGLVLGFYLAALDRPLTNNMPTLTEFTRDTQAIQRGVIVGQGNWQTQLAANQTSFMNDFVTRPELVGLYPTTDTPAQYVDKLYLHENVTPTSAQERIDAINEFGSSTTAADTSARGRALLRITNNPAFQARAINGAFVEMEYFGYLRRNPNDLQDTNFDGYNFWLNKLNQFQGDFRQSEMVNSFLISLEYRKRFGP
jgi:CSLREA domain-containing protein